MVSGSACFSSRTAWPSHRNPLSLLLEEKRRKKTEILDLTESNPTKCAFRFYGPEVLEPLSNPKNLSYDPDPRGLLEAREAVCRYYAEKNIVLKPEQVFLTAGTSEAYGFLLQLVADAGDEALAVEPGYPLFETLAGLSGVSLKKFASVYEESWRLDINSLEQAFTARTKALFIVHPNNPTGHFISSREREAIHDLCGRKGCALIVDEVFLDHAWGLRDTPASFAGQNDGLTFTLSGISKVLGLPQMKLSWIVVSGPEALRDEAMRRLEFIADTTLSVNTPAQRALGAWMRTRREAVNEINERAKTNFHYLKETASSVPTSALLDAEGGWYAVWQGPLSMNDEHFALRLLQDRNVLVHPGFLFDFPQENFLVLSLLPPALLFREGVQSLAGAMQEHPAAVRKGIDIKVN